MEYDRLRERARAQATEKAREAVVERLALISFAIWAVLALLYYILVLVPLEAHPVWGMLGGLALIIPAALPWLAYRRLVATAARGRIETEYLALTGNRASGGGSPAGDHPGDDVPGEEMVLPSVIQGSPAGDRPDDDRPDYEGGR